MLVAPRMIPPAAGHAEARCLPGASDGRMNARYWWSGKPFTTASTALR